MAAHQGMQKKQAAYHYAGQLGETGDSFNQLYVGNLQLAPATCNIQYNSQLSLHSQVPLTHVLFNFIRMICRNSFVTRELDFSFCIQVRVEYYMRVRFRVFCTRVRLLVLHSSQNQVLHASQTLYVLHVSQTQLSDLHASKISCVKSGMLHVNKTW